MKKLFPLLILLACLTASATQVVFMFTNASTGMLDTNDYKIIALGNVRNSDGSFINPGLPTRYHNPTGMATNWLTGPFYFQATNQFIGQSLYIRTTDASSNVVMAGDPSIYLGSANPYVELVTVTGGGSGATNALTNAISGGGAVVSVTNSVVTISADAPGAAAAVLAVAITNNQPAVNFGTIGSVSGSLNIGLSGGAITAGGNEMNASGFSTMGGVLNPAGYYGAGTISNAVTANALNPGAQSNLLATALQPGSAISLAQLPSVVVTNPASIITNVYGLNCVSVKIFGAKGNYYTDDTAAIQAAANFCASNGLSLYFPGTVKPQTFSGYSITNPIYLNIPTMATFGAESSSSFTIIGDGQSSSVIIQNNPTNGFVINQCSPQIAGMVFKNLSLVQNHNGGTTNFYGIGIVATNTTTGYNNCIFESVNLTGWEVGMEGNWEDTKWDTCNWWDCVTALDLNGPPFTGINNANVIINSTITQGYWSIDIANSLQQQVGFIIYNSNGNLISGNSINILSNGVAIHMNSASGNILANHFEMGNGGTSILLTNGATGTLSQNNEIAPSDSNTNRYPIVVVAGSQATLLDYQGMQTSSHSTIKSDSLTGILNLSTSSSVTNNVDYWPSGSYASTYTPPGIYSGTFIGNGFIGNGAGLTGLNFNPISTNKLTFPNGNFLTNSGGGDMTFSSADSVYRWGNAGGNINMLFPIWTTVNFGTHAVVDYAVGSDVDSTGLTFQDYYGTAIRFSSFGNNSSLFELVLTNGFVQVNSNMFCKAVAYFNQTAGPIYTAGQTPTNTPFFWSSNNAAVSAAPQMFMRVFNVSGVATDTPK